MSVPTKLITLAVYATTSTGEVIVRKWKANGYPAGTTYGEYTRAEVEWMVKAAERVAGQVPELAAAVAERVVRAEVDHIIVEIVHAVIRAITGQ